jgi:hypothetical protein
MPTGPYDEKEIDPVFRALCSTWITKIDISRHHRQRVWGNSANECYSFYCGPRSWANVMSGDIGGVGSPDLASDPTFKVSVNKTFEFVTIFGPSLYYRNAVRTVKPRQPVVVPPQFFGNNPLGYQQLLMGENERVQLEGLTSVLLESYLNWTPNEYELDIESRQQVDEALIKGRGCLSGGTMVYARGSDGDGPVRVRDIHKRIGDSWLWDGERWNKVVATKQIEKTGRELKLTLKSGEEINCTEDHIWPTRRGLLHTDQLKVGDFLQSVPIPEPEFSNNPEYIPDDIGWIIGLFLGDGNLDSKRDSRFFIAYNSKEKENRDKVCDIVNKYGGSVNLYVSGKTNGVQQEIKSPVLCSIINLYVSESGAYKKHLSSKSWNRSNNFLRSLLEGYLAADGHFVEKEGIWRLHFCNNKSLAQDLRTLCARLGLRLTLKTNTHKNGNGREKYTSYTGTIRTRKPKVNRVKGTVISEIVSISKADWRCDQFYDIQVENSPHTYALSSGTLTHNCLWTELYTPPGSSFNVIRSVWDTVDHLYCDPDAGRFTKCEWIARKMVEPVWKVESDRGLRKGSLKGNLESQHKTEEVDRSEDGDYNRKAGMTNDLLVYYKIYSKMGAGGRLQGLNPDYREPLEKLGDYVFLEVAENCPFPLNLPPDVKDLPEYTQDPAAWDQMILEMLAWPTPFWAAGEWPCTEQDFHSTFNCPWPRPHLQAGMGELKFLNWCMSFLMGKVRNTSRDFIAIKKEAGEEIKTSLLTGGDLTLLEIEAAHGNINELVSFLQHPEVNGDVWKMIEAVERNFERRVGLNDLMYGQQGDDPAMRSSYEAQARQQSTQIRPDDMRKQVEACQARVAFKEAMAARYHLRGNDVRHVFGEMGAQAWDQFVATRDLDTIAHQLEFRVESGSTERPNRQALVNEMNNAMQSVAPIFQGYAQLTGDFSPLNNLVIDWAKAHDLDAEKYQMKSVSPPQPTSPDASVTEPQKDTQNAQVPSS